MKGDKRQEVLKGFVANAFLHYRNILEAGGHVPVPTADETKMAYRTDPLFAQSVDAMIMGLAVILEMED